MDDGLAERLIEERRVLEIALRYERARAELVTDEADTLRSVLEELREKDRANKQ